MGSLFDRILGIKDGEQPPPPNRAQRRLAERQRARRQRKGDREWKRAQRGTPMD